ncbi:MAG: tetratricopeptide repeat protein [Pseudomonadota bacterium]
MKPLSWKTGLFIGLLFLGLPSVAFAGYAEGVQAYALGKFNTAYDELIPLAVEGNADAQFYIGQIYDPSNEDRLGATYDKGKQIIQKYETALRWYVKAAKQGHVAAQRQAGMFFKYGQLYSPAYKWLKRAADAGDPEAQYQLGIMYHYGMGMPRNDAEAAKWIGMGGPNMTPYQQKQYGWKAGQGFGAPAEGKAMVEILKGGGENDDALRANRMESRGTVSTRSDKDGVKQVEEYERTVGSFF